jgi:hypothetical protein
MHGVRLVSTPAKKRSAKETRGFVPKASDKLRAARAARCPVTRLF